MADELTTLRRKHGFIIPLHRFAYSNNEKLLKYAFIVKMRYDFDNQSQIPTTYIALGSTSKKIRNTFKTKMHDSITLLSITKYHEQNKLATKAKINTVNSIIERFKTDWQHIRS